MTAAPPIPFRLVGDPVRKEESVRFVALKVSQCGRGQYEP